MALKQNSRSCSAPHFLQSATFSNGKRVPLPPREEAAEQTNEKRLRELREGEGWEVTCATCGRRGGWGLEKEEGRGGSFESCRQNKRAGVRDADEPRALLPAAGTVVTAALQEAAAATQA